MQFAKASKERLILAPSLSFWPPLLVSEALSLHMGSLSVSWIYDFAEANIRSLPKQKPTCQQGQLMQVFHGESDSDIGFSAFFLQ